MLARERSAVHDKVGDLAGECLGLFQADGVLHVDHRSDMQAASRCVTIVTGAQSFGSNSGVEAGDELGQALGRHCGILDERGRLWVAAHRHQQAQPSLSHLPHLRLRGQFCLRDMGVAQTARL